jgi:hypothetical protein
MRMQGQERERSYDCVSEILYEGMDLAGKEGKERKNRKRIQ